MNSQMNMAMAASRQQDLLREAAHARRAAGVDAPGSMFSRFVDRLGAIAGARRPAPQPVPTPVRRSSSVISVGNVVAPR